MNQKITFFGKNLKFLRRLKRLTQEQLGNYLELKRNNIASYESTLVEPNLKNFQKIVEFFEIDPKEMLTKDLGLNPTDLLETEENPNLVEKYLNDNIDNFVKETSNLTKIVEGYKTFYNLKKEEGLSDTDKEVFVILDNLLDLMEAIVRLNWKLIGDLFPNEIDLSNTKLENTSQDANS